MDNNLCPDCGSKMISRLNKSNNQRFWGCSQYPKCKGTRDTDGRSRTEKYSDYQDKEKPKSRWDI
jgi:ssDNA-binding Zn-finger/Zn-ribbon topoisomerase 1